MHVWVDGCSLKTRQHVKRDESVENDVPALEALCVRHGESTICMSYLTVFTHDASVNGELVAEILLHNMEFENTMLNELHQLVSITADNVHFPPSTCVSDTK
jgi:hypothetical protein